MRLFLTILEGPSPGEADPILATEDHDLIHRVGLWIARRLHRDCDQGEDEDSAGAFDGRGGNDGS